MNDQVKLVCYKKLPIWTSETLPQGFQEKHNTKEGTWGKLTVLEGELQYIELDESGNELSRHTFSTDSPAPFVQPQVWHSVKPLSDNLKCFLEFYCEPDNYYQKKYKIAPPHTELLKAFPEIKVGTALDLGCGRGRNSFFLRSKGFQVTALDHEVDKIENIQKIISTENDEGQFQAKVFDINTETIQTSFDFILSTVVFQFLNPEAIPIVLRNIQEQTNPEGYHLIVAPLSTEAVPCPLDFSFTFKSNELKEYYKDWEILKYTEEMGSFHRTDENGNFYKAMFVTILAKKRDD